MTEKPRFFYGYTIVILSFVIMILILGLHPSFGIFLKPIIEDTGWSRTVTSGAFSVSMFFGGLVGIFMGKLNDRLGPRLAITIYGLLSGAGYLLMSQVQSVWQFYLFFGLIIGAGSNVFVPLLSTVARWFVQRRSMMTGIVYGGAGVGMLVLPLFINWLIETQSWRMSFLVLGVIVLIVVVSAAQFLKRDPGKVGQEAYGENNRGQTASSSVARSFSFQEAMRTPQFWLYAILLFFYGFSFFSVQLHIAAYVTDLGISATNAAIVLTIMGGAIVCGQIGLGSAGDKLGYKKTFLLGAVMLSLGIFVLMFARELWTFYIAAVLLGLAFGNCSTQESPLTAWLFGIGSHGHLFGFFVFCCTVGCGAGPVASGFIFDRTGSYQFAFWLSAGISIALIIMMAFLKSPTAVPAPKAGYVGAVRAEPGGTSLPS